MKYTGEYTKEISFPLGGIGTGSIGLAGNGCLIDWEIFNRPNKGSINGFTNFSIRAVNNGKIIPRVIRGDANKDFMGQYGHTNSSYGFGPNPDTLCGFPHFQNSEFIGEFPMASIIYNDNDFPAELKMSAFNPFIPGDAENSSIPAAFFEFEIFNPEKTEITYQIAFSVSNPGKGTINKKFAKNGISGLTLSNDNDKSDPKYSDFTIATDCENSHVQTYWYRGGWRDPLVTFWNEFSSTIDIKDRSYSTVGNCDTGTVTAEVKVKPSEMKKVRFVFGWNVPNCYNYWDEYKDRNGKNVQWKNYYASIFENSTATAIYSLKNWHELHNRTEKFKNAIYSSTLPDEVKDAAFSNLAVLKSPTVLRLEDGSFYGWEGVAEDKGSCEGTCQHVWNYAYALCFLFPKLERSIRDMEFKYSTDENGRTAFRIKLPLGREKSNFRACLDGQMGTVIKCYREWKLSGDNEWLKGHWNEIKKILEYAWSDANPDCWDKDMDGVLEGRQHHTLDMELFGASSWLEGMYLAALKAAAEMAGFLGDNEKAAEYTKLFKNGYNWTKNNLFNGKYFIQKLDISDKSIPDRFNADNYWNEETKEIKYQIGEGSAIDQVLAQWHSDIIGLGDIFDNKQLISALFEMMKNNFKPHMRFHTNPWRIFSVNDEAGTVICDYPEGTDKPKIPIPYCEETMTGFEYSFAGILFAHEMYDEGLKVAKAVRDRYDGKKRNPWNEFECGSNYARSMASFALVPILSGFKFDLPNKFIGFNPYKKDKFRSIWSVDGAWGEFVLDDDKVSISVIEGKITLSSLGLNFYDNISNLKIDGKLIDFNFKNGIIYFDEIEISEKMEIIS